MAEALIDDINTDVKVALNSLARPDYAVLANDPFFGGAQAQGDKPENKHLNIE